QGARAERDRAALDHRHLRLHGRRLADHDGHAGGPHRPPAHADDRRRRLRGRVGTGRALDQRRDADRDPGAPGNRRRDRRAVDDLGPLAAGSVAAGLVLGALFARRQRTLADPLVDLSLFANRAFSSGLALYTLSILAVFGAFLFVPQYLQLVRGLSPLEAGL